MTVVDPTGMHVYQPGFLYVALGQANGRWLSRDERTLLRRDVDLVDRTRRSGSTPRRSTVQLGAAASLDWDYLVLATGARLVPDAIPGLVEGVPSSIRSRARSGSARSFAVSAAAGSTSASPASRTSAPRRRSSSSSCSRSTCGSEGIRDRSEITLLSPLNRAFTIESRLEA